jgi:hypothetical protein
VYIATKPHKQINLSPSPTKVPNQKNGFMFPMNMFDEDDMNDISGIANEISLENTFEIDLFKKGSNISLLENKKASKEEEENFFD